MWRMRRLLAWEGPQLWHKEVSQSNGYYNTACGLRFGMAGSANRYTVPAGACARCMKYSSQREPVPGKD
jgi:hypothetical protein